MKASQPPPSPRPRFARTCRDITWLVLEREERPLRWQERWAVRVHLLICRACPRFATQLALMRSAMGRWSSYREPDNEA